MLVLYLSILSIKTAGVHRCSVSQLFSLVSVFIAFCVYIWWPFIAGFFLLFVCSFFLLRHQMGNGIQVLLCMVQWQQKAILFYCVLFSGIRSTEACACFHCQTIRIMGENYLGTTPSLSVPDQISWLLACIQGPVHVETVRSSCTNEHIASDSHLASYHNNNHMTSWQINFRLDRIYVVDLIGWRLIVAALVIML